MTMHARTTRRGQGGRWLWGVAALIIGGACSEPRYHGAQVQEPPYNFMWDANASQGRNVFPERQQLAQGGWFHNIGNDDEHSSLFITTYAGASGRPDVQAARDDQAKRYGSYMRYGDLERFVIDGRTAWGWLETQIYRGDIASLEYKAVVSYDSVTYAIEFFSSEPVFMNVTTLRDVVKTFAIGQRIVNYRAIVLTAFASLVVAWWFWSRIIRERSAPVPTGQAPTLAEQRSGVTGGALAGLVEGDVDRLPPTVADHD